MSRDSNQILNLNSVDASGQQANEENPREEDLQIFSNTTFFDLDIGRSTDIATTVDELLMQQEKQIQYPHKQQPLDDGHNYGLVAGPSHSQLNNRSQNRQKPSSNRLQASQIPASGPSNQDLPFDFSTLQGFSLAGQLPQASLSIYDVDPMFHDHQRSNNNVSNQGALIHHSTSSNGNGNRVRNGITSGNGNGNVGSTGVGHHDIRASGNGNGNGNGNVNVNGNGNGNGTGNGNENGVGYGYGIRPTNSEPELNHHHIGRQRPIQRHELADQYAPKESPGFSGEHGATDDEKRKRNTAASARFRVKKKLREQEMEKTHRHMQQQLAEQVERIKQLEMENSWLKSLVVEKNMARDTSSLGKLREELLNKEKQA